ISAFCTSVFSPFHPGSLKITQKLTIIHIGDTFVYCISGAFWSKCHKVETQPARQKKMLTGSV
ncbi:MAG: hypothetical protein Q4C02_03840, partial [Eubacteriales bacterium]|nr:hypothetical protein [Eubacteriales bacterium]